jgi:two-component system sensor histidine kinase BaeS
MTWLRSLGGRITLVTVAVAVLAVLVTGLTSLQLVRQSTLADAKAQLAAQATALAKSSSGVALGDSAVAYISADGVVTGDAARYVGPALARRVLTHGTVSLVERKRGSTVVVEGRRTAVGTGIVVVRSQDSLESTTRETARRIGLALLIGVAVAILAGVLLGRWLARPLVKVAATARRMAAGERGLPTPVHKPAEIADVSDALATLDTALTTSEGRQREFLLSISHELRTPLTAVRGYGEAMTDGLVKPEDIAGVGATLVAETERLDRFVADLLELARLEADDFVIHPQPVELSALLAQVRDAWQGRSSTLGVSIDISSPPRSITTDGRRLRQVIDGLVENALRVSPAGSAVRITAAGDPVTIEVTDGGPGLADDDLRVAFDRGVLRDRYRDERPVGTGLGLSIAARLVSRLGGTIRVSNAPGAGARFSVTLPSAPGGS